MPWLEWISLFLRWFHVIAGVAWIGASFYFIWLDNHLKPPPQWKKDKGIKGDLWAVHGGGFYEVAKYEYGPDRIPEPLHWFKWEAYTTWISGFALLVVIYYLGASAYLIDPNVMALDPVTAVGLGLGLIVGGLGLYEIACRSALGKHPIAFAVFLLGLLSLSSFLASSWFSGRGAYIHVGALVGTIMAGNVFFKIIPSQRLMVEAVRNKQSIDPDWGLAAKLRSVHNNYLTLPLLFIMISNHYPMTYQHPHNWLVLIAIALTSAWIRHFFNLKHAGINKPGILLSGAGAMAAIVLWVSWPNADSRALKGEMLSQPVLQADVQGLINKHCVSCHAREPIDSSFAVAPLGLELDTWNKIDQNISRIHQRTVVTRDMPFLNKTGMTDDERRVIDLWVKQQHTDPSPH